VAQYASIFLLCYLGCPAGIIVALAAQIGLTRAGRELTLQREATRAFMKIKNISPNGRVPSRRRPGAAMAACPVGREIIGGRLLDLVR
jgi:hypothetical protein